MKESGRNSCKGHAPKKAKGKGLKGLNFNGSKGKKALKDTHLSKSKLRA